MGRSYGTVTMGWMDCQIDPINVIIGMVLKVVFGADW